MSLIAHSSTAIAMLFILAGCSTTPLTLYTEFIGREQLASYHVHTPDPRLTCPDIGQRLVIRWSLPEELFNAPDLHLSLALRFHNGREEQLDYPIATRKGSQLLYILNARFQETGGIATYKAELKSGLMPLLEWKHLLWNETIELLIPEEAVREGA